MVNLEDDKVIVSSVRETYMIGFFRPIFKVMSLSVSIDSLDQEKRMSIHPLSVRSPTEMEKY